MKNLFFAIAFSLFLAVGALDTVFTTQIFDAVQPITAIQQENIHGY